jgi:hypothetical protein
MHAARHRRPPRIYRPAPPLLDPPGDLPRVGPGLPAQPGGLAGHLLIRLALRGALEDPGHLGQQVTPAARELAQRGHRGGLLAAAQLPPPGAAARLAEKLGDQQPVSLRARIDHAF